MTTPENTLSPRAARLAVLLENESTRTVALSRLWILWTTSEPALSGRPEQRTALAEVLEQLTAAGLVSLSKKQDLSARPHLPVRVTLPPQAHSESAAALTHSIVWRPELAWVLNARLTLGQVERLRLINAWLRDHGHGDDVLPLRERSLEVLGHEKSLDALLATTIFAPGRLTLERLRTFRTKPPLPAIRIGDGPVMVVVENDNTFHSVHHVLTEEPGPVGHIAWGVGGTFEASVRSTDDLPGVKRVRYFGDLDADGLRIPRNAAATADHESLPPVLPAIGLYRALLETSVRHHGQTTTSPSQANNLAAWLADSFLVQEAASLLVSGVRIPQEALTRTALARDRSWLADM